MNKNALFIICLLVLPSVNAQAIISGVHVPDTVYSRELLDVQVILDDQTRDWKSIVSIPELGIVKYGSHHSLAQDGHSFLELPERIVPGEYLVRVQVRQGDDDEAGQSRFRHRWISVIG